MRSTVSSPSSPAPPDPSPEVATDPQAALLRFAAGEPIVEFVLDDEQFDELDRWALHRNLALALSTAVEQGKLHVSSHAAERLRRQTMALTVSSLRTRAAHRRATRALRERSIPCLTIKGMATSRLDFPDPGVRQFGDVDLLVPRKDAVAARRALEDAGFVQSGAEAHSWAHMGHATAYRFNDEAEVDLHHRLARLGPGRLLEGADFFEGAVAFELDGEEAWAPDRCRRLLIAAANYTFTIAEQRNWTTFADLIVLSRDAEALARAIDLADEIGLGRCLRSAIAVAHDAAGLAAPPLPPVNGSWRDRLVAWAHDKAVPVPWRERTAFALLFPGATARSVVGWLRPGEDYLASTGQSQREYLQAKAAQKILGRDPG